jgi:tRNA-specific 2-thiouridylase
VKKDIPENIVYVSNGYDPISMYRSEVYLKEFRFISHNPYGDAFFEGMDVSFKIRHTPEFSMGKVFSEEGLLKIVAEKPIAGLAPGQFGVVYDKDGNLCLGSGMISEEKN